LILERQNKKLRLKIPSEATPLWLAAESGNISLTKILLENGAKEYRKSDEQIFSIYHTEEGYLSIDIAWAIINEDQDRIEFSLKHNPIIVNILSISLSGMLKNQLFFYESFMLERHEQLQ